MVFGRVGTAMVTPFDDNGNIDFDKATVLVNYLLDNGTDSLRGHRRSGNTDRR